ncbi:hypothetical protein BG011_008416 [Mortierella polycephala]|uniref:SWIRM domain-containing protein n=1 Tax=Mortierella polycephala TaxID=41804 RepID=A0A9P6PPN7_9FUNG|nr:hypothetical protein BG011_008416 [Mortierella polycephala]
MAAATASTGASRGHRESHGPNAASPLGKRIRKKVELFNPSHQRKRRSTRIRDATTGSNNINSSRPHSRSRSRSQGSTRSRQVRREDQKLNDAAHASRLHAHGLCIEEFELFQFHIGRSDLESYLKIRNTMLWLWRESPKEPLTLTRAFEATKNFGLHPGLIAHIYEFLLRSGYINFGACAWQDDAFDRSSKMNDHHQDEKPPPSSAAAVATAALRKTIVVIGSGIAGVGVAKQLENLFRYYAWKFAPGLPPKVVVLEARDRVGGRMHSMELRSKAPSTPVQPEQQHLPYTRTVKRHAVDLGAQIITGFENGNPMEVIVRRQMNNLELHYLVDESCDLFDHDGKLVSKEIDIHCETVFNQILEQACQLREKKELPRDLRNYLGERAKRDYEWPGRVKSTTLPTLGHSMDYFIESHPEFKSWTHQELGLIHWHYANLEFANATPLDQISLRHWDQDDDYEFSGHHCMVAQGYGQVPVILSQGLDIRLNMPVSSINHNVTSRTLRRRLSRGDAALSEAQADPIQVQCRDGTVIDCSAAIVTVPLGVLKSQQIQFSPPLPTWKEQAIQHLGFGLLNKLVLVFDRVFWEPSVGLFGYVGSGKEGSYSSGYDLNAYRSSRGKFYMFWNCIIVSGLPVLVTLMAGQSAYDCENMSKEELVQEAVETLALIYPDIRPIPAPIETVVTRWAQDEFAQGSYSFVGKEGTGEDYDLLAKPVENRLFFAGEATSRHYPATAHGAYLSGLKVAKDILDSLIGPQVVQSSRNGTQRNSRMTMDRDEEASKESSEDEGESNRSSVSTGSLHSHLMSMEDARTTAESPPLHAPLFMSLGHGFMVPRRRGRVSRSMIAKFVAERSDDDDDDDDSNDGSEDESTLKRTRQQQQQPHHPKRGPGRPRKTT